MNPNGMEGGSRTNCWQHPPSFYCPISQQCMRDPVVLSDGQTYERAYITRWLQEHDTSPVTGVQLLQKDMFPNHALRNAIEEYFEEVFSHHRWEINRTRASQDAANLSSSDSLLHTINALMQVAMLVHADLSTEEVLQKIMDEAKALVGAEVASVFLHDKEKQELYSTVNSTGAELRIPASMGIAGHVATTGESLIVDNAYGDPRFNKDVDTKTGFKTRNIMCVPLKLKKGGVIGVVNLLNKISTDDLASFSAEDQQFLLVFASQAATAITTGGGLPQPKPKEVSQRELRSDSFFGLRGFLCCAQRERAVVVDGEAQVSGPRLLAVPRLNRLNDMTATHSTGVAVSSTTTSAWTQAEVSITSPRLVIPSPCVSDGESDDDDMDDCFEELEVARFLAEAFDSWTMDAHRLVEITGNKPLSTLGCYLCERLGLVQEFRLHPQRLRRFLKEVERGYSEANPYHNSAHAASVMHLMHVLMHRGDVASAAAKACEGPEGLGSTNRSLVQLAGLLAAAVHDYEHEGVTNDFLVKTHNEKAVRYNDQRVNEEHHVAAACTTLIRPECHFVRDMPLADFRQLRSLIIDLVVHTDMGEHDRTLAHFMKILDDAAREDGAASSEAKDDQKRFVPETPVEARSLLRVALKCADLGHLAMEWEDHKKWVHCLESEFFAQGDREKELGLPVSFLMDRSLPGASATQLGFMDKMVLPLFRALVRVVPATAPVLEAVTSNYARWVEVLDERGDNKP